MKARANIISAFVFMACSSSAYAETSSEYAKLSQKLWASFTCAMAAADMKDSKAQARLFNIGYESGKKFYEALTQDKINEKDVNSGVPVGVLWHLQGPNANFALGRVWESVADEYHQKVREECPGCNANDDLRKIRAEDRFREMNCGFLE